MWSNTTDAFFDIGLRGNGLFPARPRDEFGIAYAYTNLSEELKENLDLPVGLERLRGGALSRELLRRAHHTMASTQASAVCASAEGVLQPTIAGAS